MTNRKDEIERIIIQGIGHQERRNILKIISLADSGASYSEILGELGLNTGRMNYHLKLLEGLVVRNGDRRYHLTPIGKKALSLLHSMTENLENGYEKYLKEEKAPKTNGIAIRLNRRFYQIVAYSITAMFFLSFFVYTSVTYGYLPPVSYYFLPVIGLLTVVLLVWLRSWIKKESERLNDELDSIIDRLKSRNN